MAGLSRGSISMKETEDVALDLDAYIDAASALVRLNIPAASKPIVIANLEVAVRFAALVEEFDCGEREEPAPVFRP
jgi:hypothetical protein